MSELNFQEPFVKYEERIPLLGFVLLMVFSTFINAANSKGRMRIVGSKGYSVIFYCDGEAGLLSSYNQKVGQ